MRTHTTAGLLALTLLAVPLTAGTGGAVSAGGSAAPTSSVDHDKSETAAVETYRPVYHHSVPDHWKNDPQRPVFIDGEFRYHYLYNADYDHAGGTSWRLTSTTDNVVFRDQGVAAEKGTNANGDLWSGSTVVDHGNTAGFGAGAVVMLVTQMDHATSPANTSGGQAQFLWYSTDGGRTFRPHGEEPVIPNGGREHFRDPKVVWDEERAQWVALLAEEDRVSFWTSPDLTAWERVSEYVRDDLGMIECPDLFQVRADDGTLHWVLGISGNAQHAGDPATYAYWTGDFDGATFVPDAHDPQWLDHGFDWYGAVTWEDPDAPLDRRFALAWMNSWAYPHTTPTWEADGFNGTDSIVREVTLAGGSDPAHPYSLVSRPVAALDDHATATTSLGDVAVDGHRELGYDGTAYRLETTIARGDAENVGIQLRRSSDGSRHADVGAFFGDDGAYSYLNREGTGNPDPTGEQGESRAPLRTAAGETGDEVHLTVLVDRTTIEVFVDDGRVVHSSQVFADPEDAGLALYAVGGESIFQDLTLTTFADVGRPASRLLADFEGDALPDEWTATGGLAGLAPTPSDLRGQAGHRVLDTFAGADSVTGVVTSAPFTVDRRWLRFRIAGGEHPLGVEPATSVNLLLDGRPVRTATGRNDITMRLVEWDVADLLGREVELQVLDDATGAWGHLMVDHVTLSD